MTNRLGSTFAAQEAELARTFSRENGLLSERGYRLLARTALVSAWGEYILLLVCAVGACVALAGAAVAAAFGAWDWALSFTVNLVVCGVCLRSLQRDERGLPSLGDRARERWQRTTPVARHAGALVFVGTLAIALFPPVLAGVIVALYSVPLALGLCLWLLNRVLPLDEPQPVS